jgi:ABC-2 type transport system ATP-binding protein
MNSVIVCDNLTKHYKNITALDRLNLEISENTILGFLGINGAGKTTTIKLLNNLIKPTAGNAYIFGQSIVKNPLKLKTMIGYLSQEPAFYPWMTCREFLTYVGEVFNLKKNTIRERVGRLLHDLDLASVAEKRIGEFSTGMRQRLGIAQALINEPKVVFLDEPVSSLDPLGRIQVLNIIKSLKGKATIVMSSHILNDVERVCDEVAIIDHGKLLIHEKLPALKDRYFSRTILMHCQEPLQRFKDLLQKQDFIKTVEWIAATPEMPNGLKIISKDFALAEKELPALIVKHGLILKHYEFLSPNLEDIFISLVHNPIKEN